MGLGVWVLGAGSVGNPIPWDNYFVPQLPCNRQRPSQSPICPLINAEHIEKPKEYLPVPGYLL